MQDIKIENLYKAYGEKQVLNNFSAVIEHGKISCIMAPSGAGKTTLLRILMGMEKADRGKITGLENLKIRAVFQEDRLCEELDAVSNIRLVKYKNNKKTVQDALCKMGLTDIENKPVSTLSGGMKRRVSILRALLSDFDVLFLDEPLKGLDMHTKQMVLNEMKNYFENKTIIMITHEKDEAEFFGAKVIGIEA